MCTKSRLRMGGKGEGGRRYWTINGTVDVGEGDKEGNKELRFLYSLDFVVCNELLFWKCLFTEFASSGLWISLLLAVFCFLGKLIHCPKRFVLFCVARLQWSDILGYAMSSKLILTSSAQYSPLSFSPFASFHCQLRFIKTQTKGNKESLLNRLLKLKKSTSNF